jgi:hypothetical protein
MNRREFLSLHIERRGRIAELSCERLYMRYLDSQLSSAGASDAAVEGESEPPRIFGNGSTPDLFETLARHLENADVVRVAGRSWLSRDDFRRRLEPVLTAFVARGGRVE